jgi:hypothetical protein
MYNNYLQKGNFHILVNFVKLFLTPWTHKAVGFLFRGPNSLVLSWGSFHRQVVLLRVCENVMFISILNITF